ncbi:hypothetical protein GCM10010976_09910 [Bizionia arctica]|uniref:Carboxypeptidase-like regulatory domain-containing protein n=2 Tax=Bizionia arctica TaxID=1495645 RepID=A0A917LLM7_9FLAO|nr:hypothetical protein GCM10010976_09910 [Bizionia arctica]
MIALLVSNPIYAQTDKASTNEEITVKGVVKDEFSQPLEANITLKGTTVGTSTDKDGTFTFPKELKKNDILIFTHLGFNTTEIKINEKHTFLEVTMGTEVVEMLGAPEVDKPYKSKRNK